jgi:hypothetical protein
MIPDEKTKKRPRRTDSGMRPFAVPLPEASRLLGNKSHSEIYNEVGLGNLDAVKDGYKTLITIESIDRYTAAWPPAKIRPTARVAARRRPRTSENRNDAA